MQLKDRDMSSEEDEYEYYKQTKRTNRQSAVACCFCCVAVGDDVVRFDRAYDNGDIAEFVRLCDSTCEVNI